VGGRDKTFEDGERTIESQRRVDMCLKFQGVPEFQVTRGFLLIGTTQAHTPFATFSDMIFFLMQTCRPLNWERPFLGEMKVVNSFMDT